MRKITIMNNLNQPIEAPVAENTFGATNRRSYSGEELMSILEPQIRAMFR